MNIPLRCGRHPFLGEWRYSRIGNGWYRLTCAVGDCETTVEVEGVLVPGDMLQLAPGRVYAEPNVRRIDNEALLANERVRLTVPVPGAGIGDRAVVLYPIDEKVVVRIGNRDVLLLTRDMVERE